MRIGIVNGGSYENRELQRAISSLAERVLIDPTKIFYKFENGISTMFSDGAELNLDALIIRVVGGNALSVLGKVANLSGVLSDPADRYVTKGIPKVMSEITRQFSTQPNKPGCYLSFSADVMRSHMGQVVYPVVYRPARGNHGEGFELCNDERELTVAISRHSYRDGENPIFLQQYLPILREYRVYCWNKTPVAFIKKFIAKNSDRLFKGRRFDRIDALPDDIRDYCVEHSKPGLVGIDIIKTKGDNLIYIIEQNRAPEFERTDQTNGNHTAELIIRAILNEGAL